jgi:AcrR family transcriptional regulator
MSETVAEKAVTPDAARATRAPSQKRGQQRVEDILDAAEAVFGEMGVEAGSTNAIAERAGASVGSLYHFFPNKDAILHALAERYSVSVQAVLRRERRIDEPWVPIEELMPQMVRAFAMLDEQHPGYMAVCRATDTMSGGKSAISLRLEAAMEEMVAELLLLRCPGMPESEARTHATLSCITMHANLDHISAVPEAQRGALQQALVHLMVQYFQPIEARYPRP